MLYLFSRSVADSILIARAVAVVVVVVAAVVVDRRSSLASPEGFVALLLC
jgi:hypothetical protein